MKFIRINQSPKLRTDEQLPTPLSSPFPIDCQAAITQTMRWTQTTQSDNYIIADSLSNLIGPTGLSSPSTDQPKTATPTAPATTLTEIYARKKTRKTKEKQLRGPKEKIYFPPALNMACVARIKIIIIRSVIIVVVIFVVREYPRVVAMIIRDVLDLGTSSNERGQKKRNKAGNRNATQN